MHAQHATDSDGPDRFRVPLYTVSEAARYLGVPDSTFRAWARGYVRQTPGRPNVLGSPVVTTLRRSGLLGPVVPFIGLAEGMVLTAMRQAGVPLQRIRPALSQLAAEFGVDHALASRRLFTDGAEVLFDYAADVKDSSTARAVSDLVVVRNGQRVFVDAVQSYLRRLEFDAQGYARLVRLPGYQVADIVVDPRRAFGQPVFSRGGARLEDALALFRAGESVGTVATEYGIPPDQFEDVLRAATRHAA